MNLAKMSTDSQFNLAYMTLRERYQVTLERALGSLIPHCVKMSKRRMWVKSANVMVIHSPNTDFYIAISVMGDVRIIVDTINFCFGINNCKPTLTISPFT